MVEAIGGAQAVGGPTAPLAAELLDAAAEQLAKEYDAANGGFGGAPKFPPHMNLLFLLRHHQRTGAARSLEIVRHTCEAMARGGIYDQLAGGFARYSVDGHWTVPHFEKMLYDNALLLRVYTQLWRLTGDPLAAPGRRRDRRVPARDLGTRGRAGLGAGRRHRRASRGSPTSGRRPSSSRCWGRTTAAWPPTCSRSPTRARSSTARACCGWPGTSTTPTRRWSPGGSESGPGCCAARDARPQPARDDKVVAAWNGLAVTALVEHAAARPGGPVDRRRGASEIGDGAGRPATSWPGGCAGSRATGSVGEPAGVLEDYGCVAEAFCALHQLTGEGRWLALAGGAARRRAGAVRRTGRAASTTPPTTPSGWSAGPPTPPTTPPRPGWSAIVAALVAYAALTGETRYREAAEAALATVAPIVGRHARFTGYAATVGGGAALRAVRDRGGHRRPGRGPAGRGGAPARPARRGDRGGPPGPARGAAARRPADGRRAAHRVRLPGFRLRPPGDHGGRPGRPARLSRAAPSRWLRPRGRAEPVGDSARSGGARGWAAGGPRLAALWIPEPVCPLSAWWAAASWPG